MTRLGKKLVGLIITLLLSLPAAQAKSDRIAQRLYNDEPTIFSFYCDFTSKKFNLSRRTEIKITSHFYLSEIIANPVLTIDNEAPNRISAMPRCYEVWLPRIKESTIAYFTAVRRDLESRIGPATLMLYEKVDTPEKRVLLAEQERKIDQLRRQLSEADELLRQLQQH